MEIKMEKKVCTKCNKEKSLTEYHKKRDAKNGLTSACKECRNAQNKKYREEKPEKETARKKKWREENKEKVKAYWKKYREENPEKIKAIKKKYYQENPEYNKAYWKKYREENPEKVRARNKKYYQENKEQIRAKNKKYREENKEQIRASARLSDSKRRAQKRNTQVEVITDELLKEYWIKKNIDPQRCFYCEEGLYEHLEHCIPLSRGGTHTKDNLVPSCAPCNLSKGTKTPDEWEG